MTRKFIDCREVPSDVNCSLAIYGEPEEVVQATVQHMKTTHGHTEADEELAEMVRSGMKDATGAA
jgi:predicted small metal-binding protein